MQSHMRDAYIHHAARAKGCFVKLPISSLLVWSILRAHIKIIAYNASSNTPNIIFLSFYLVCNFKQVTH